MEYGELDELVENFDPFCKLWETAFFFNMDLESWLTDFFIKIQSAPVEKKLDSYYKDTTKLLKRFDEIEEGESARQVAILLREDIE